MAEFPYTTVPGKIKSLMIKIREVAVPQKVTGQWLKTVGFKSSNDASLIGILKFIGLIDSSGSPTARWTEYRGSKHKQILGKAIQDGYKDLFAVYTDANQRSQAELDHVFSTNSSGGKQVVAKTLATFRALVEQGEFAKTDEQGELGTPSSTNTLAAPKSTDSRIDNSSPSLHIDIQIHISPEASAEQIDQIFSSMAKHLYSSRKPD